jgi:hypothetical protein
MKPSPMTARAIPKTRNRVIMTSTSTFGCFDNNSEVTVAAAARD